MRIVIATSLVLAIGCQGSAADPNASVQFDRVALLTQAADCAVGRYDAFLPLARDLEAKTAALSAGTATLADAQASWSAAIASWQEAELFSFGPAASQSQPGGQNFRDLIYSWPLLSRCQIDQQLVSKLYADPAAFQAAGSLITGRGFAALEYLLFYAGTDNGCPGTNAINTSGSWTALSAAELNARKAAYAAAAATDVRVQTEALLRAWDPAGGNFRNELLTAGAGSKTYVSQQTALNAVSNAMFYVEVEDKDTKLGKVLGLGDCLKTTCPEDWESQYAHASTAHLKANLVGFRRLYQGCSLTAGGLGFDDWLVAAGASAASADLQTKILAAQASLDGLTMPLEQALTQDPKQVASVYGALKGITDILKTQFVSVLRLEPPVGTEGDND
jgi:predicted lipoprotein